MLKEVIKIQFLNLLSNSVNKNKKKINYLIALSPLLLFLYLSCLYSFIFMEAFEGQEYLVLYLMIIIAFSLVFMLCIQQAQGHLFGFKDYDLLMSLPITNRDILISKVVSFAMLQLLYFAFLFLPAAFIYAHRFNCGILYYLYMIIGLIPLIAIPLVVSSIIGILVKKVTLKTRYKNLINNIIMILIVIIIMSGSMYFSRMSNSIADIESFNNNLSKMQLFLPSIYYYVKGILNENLLMIIVSLVINIGIFALFVYIFDKTYINLNQNDHVGFHVRNFHINKLKASSIKFTLFKKEFLRFIKNFIYVFNMAFGELLLVLGSLYLLINAHNLSNIFGEFYLIFKDQMVGLVIVAILAFSAITNTCGVSISLEGKQLWITKTLPVKTIDILMSKVFVNVVIIFVPALIAIILLKFALNLSLFECLLCIIFALELGFVVGLFGIIVNLHFPKLDFDREVLVIKQSVAAFIVVFTSITLAMFGSILIIRSLLSYSALSIVLLVDIIGFIMAICLYLYLVNYGVKIFDKL